MKKKKFHPIIVITGMHLKKKYGSTHTQIEKDFSNTDIYKIYNYNKNDSMDIVLAKTIKYFGQTIKKINQNEIDFTKNYSFEEYVNSLLKNNKSKEYPDINNIPD